MYKHIVLWKMRESAQGLDRRALASEVKRRLTNLPALIPEIVGFEVGLNIGAYGAQFFDVSLIATYADEQAFKRYCVHPIHDEVVAYITAVTAAEQIVDYYL